MIRRLILTAAGVTALAACTESKKEPERLVLTPGPGDYHRPAYSRDGMRLAYRGTIDGKMRIWVSGLDGSGAVALTPERFV